MPFSNFRVRLIGLCLIAVAAVLSATALNRPVTAQVRYSAGITVAVSAESTALNPGQSVNLAVALTNAGTSPITLRLGCTPPFDLQVRDGNGNLVWRQNPSCTNGITPLTLAPGETRTWTGVWPGTRSNGSPAPAGLYGVWGVVETLPMPSISGPVELNVGNVQATAIGQRPTATMTRQPAATRTPSRTNTPGSDRPTSTATRSNVEPTRTNTPGSDRPTPTATRSNMEPTRTNTPGSDRPTPTATRSNVEPTRTNTPREGEPTRTPTRSDVEPTRTPTRATPIGGERFTVVEGMGNQRQPDVAGDAEQGDCQNLVVWWDERESAIFGRFVNRTERRAAFEISGDSPSNGAPSVAYNRERRLWLVAWPGPSGDAESEIRARYVDCGGVEGGVFTVAPGPADDTEPAVAAFDDAFGVVWTKQARSVGGVLPKAEIWGARIVGTGSLNLVRMGPAPFETAASQPAVACEPGEPCLVVWRRGGGDSGDIVARYWFPHEEYVGDKLLVVAGEPQRERYPSVAWNGSDGTFMYLVTWTMDGERPNVRARGVQPAAMRGLDDYQLGTQVLTIGEGGQWNDHADVTALGRDFVVVWANGPTSLQDILARRVLVTPGTRAMAGAPLVPVSSGSPVERFPVVAVGGDALVLGVWEALWENMDIDVLGRHVSVPRP